jgi:hypothetical protein
MLYLRNNLLKKGFTHPRGIPSKKIALPSSGATALKARLLMHLKLLEANSFLKE